MIDAIKDCFTIEGWQIALAFLIDLLIGDPRWLPHPVRIMGFFIHRLEILLRRFFKGAASERIGGVFLMLIMVSSTFFISCLAVSLFYRLADEGAILIGAATTFIFVLVISTTIATRELITSCMKVIDYLKEGNLKMARNSLSMIVGRDTENLSEEEVLRATMETLSENLSDGVVAPLFYLVLGGLPLAMTYKVINTMDSMIGYKNERYRYFGWAAARLDDIVNYIPARLSAALIMISIFFVETAKSIYRIFNKLIFKKSAPLRRFIILTVFMIYDFLLLIKDSLLVGYLFTRRSFLVTLMDGKNHPSPNSGYPEAALSGALGIRLGGPATYEGVVVNKPYIGLSLRALDTAVAMEGIILVTLSALIAAMIAVLVRL
ncbi:MAG: adenosylcobinamide-phosphate synthase CbiB [Thermodesulfovibrionales bacterium]|nr:adenosylcobinamide-phosphate synthase CbiB [Thermodesulfovibrionales bacterium]